MRASVLSALPLVAWLVASPVAAAAGIESGEVAHKIVRKADQDGDLLVSVKAKVTNNTDQDQTVTVTVQALDAEGFEVTDIPLLGKVRARSSRFLTDTTYIHQDSYKTIVKWQIEGGEEEEEAAGK